MKDERLDGVSRWLQESVGKWQELQSGPRAQREEGEEQAVRTLTLELPMWSPSRRPSTRGFACSPPRDGLTGPLSAPTEHRAQSPDAYAAGQAYASQPVSATRRPVREVRAVDPTSFSLRHRSLSFADLGSVDAELLTLAFTSRAPSQSSSFRERSRSAAHQLDRWPKYVAPGGSLARSPEPLAERPSLQLPPLPPGADEAKQRPKAPAMLMEADSSSDVLDRSRAEEEAARRSRQGAAEGRAQRTSAGALLGLPGQQQQQPQRSVDLQYPSSSETSPTSASSRAARSVAATDETASNSNSAHNSNQTSSFSRRRNSGSHRLSMEGDRHLAEGPQLPDLSADVITALLKGYADAERAPQPLPAEPEPEGGPQGTGLAEPASAAAAASQPPESVAEAEQGSSPLSPFQLPPPSLTPSRLSLDALRWPALRFAWADEVDGPERLAFASSPPGPEQSQRPLPCETVGAFSCHGAREVDGAVHPKINQDCALVCFPFGEPEPGSGPAEPMALLALLDGHGEDGELVSRKAGPHLCSLLQEHPLLRAQPAEALFDAFAAVEAALELPVAAGGLLEHCEDSGACCVLVLLLRDELWAAHVGDCRAVLGCASHEQPGEQAHRHEFASSFFPVELTHDQKPERPDERERVLGCGAQVQPSVSREGIVWEPSRLFSDLSNKGLGPGLTMTRALGDLGARSVGLIAEPEVSHRALGPDDRFLVVASDGLWEFIDSQLAVEIVGTMLEGGQPAQLAALALITTAANRWFSYEGESYRDDITVVVVYLDGLAPVFATATLPPRLAKGPSLGAAKARVRSESLSHVDLGLDRALSDEQRRSE